MQILSLVAFLWVLCVCVLCFPLCLCFLYYSSGFYVFLCVLLCVLWVSVAFPFCVFVCLSFLACVCVFIIFPGFVSLFHCFACGCVLVFAFAPEFKFLSCVLTFPPFGAPR